MFSMIYYPLLAIGNMNIIPGILDIETQITRASETLALPRPPKNDCRRQVLESLITSTIFL